MAASKKRALVLIALMIGAAGEAAACSCAGLPALADEVASSRLVVSARVAAVEDQLTMARKVSLWFRRAYAQVTGRPVKLRPRQYGMLITLQPITWFKGSGSGALKLVTGRSQGDCGVDFTKGETYLVFVNKRNPEWYDVDLCSRTKRLSEAQNELAFLRTAAGPKKARTPEDYRPRTLAELAREERDAESLGNKLETMTVHGNVFPSRVRVAYTGVTRPLPPLKKEVLRQWARLYAGAPESYTGPYQSEIQVHEDGTPYWVAVRENFGNGPERRPNRGSEFDLYLIRLGAAKMADEWEPLFLIERSDSVP